MTIEVPPINNDEEYEDTLVRLAELLAAPGNSKDDALREALLEAIEAYEDKVGMYD